MCQNAGEQTTKQCAVHSFMKNVGPLVARIILGAIFIYAGYEKLGEGFPKLVTSLAAAHFFWPTAWAYAAAIFEIIGGAMVLLGVFAGYAATVLALMMAVAMLTIMRGAPAMSFYTPTFVITTCLFLMSVGAGKYRLVKKECLCSGCAEEAGCCGGEKKMGGCCKDKMNIKK